MSSEGESNLRRQLGIPSDAERVIVFAESSHWDPNWVRTSEQYYTRYVQHNLDQALQALRDDPRRVYSVECMFFLRLYWERHPEQHAAIRELVNARRLRLTGSGVTTADTLLPGPEAILRDLLLGQEWLRRNGMMQEPRLAYFTDSFGCSPALPSLLRAAGFDRTAITRLDGMLFLGAELELGKGFPRPGSSAHRLLKEERTLDFVWRDAQGAEVLAHWNAFTYGQGDMLAYRGISRVYLVRLAFLDRSERHVARRIAQYVRELVPLARTPYLFCPIGFDFVEPIPDLVGLLERYNRLRYPVTGVWAVNAGLDDYLTLVKGHRERLPTLQLDPNPYWTGFYTSRPALKRRCRELVERLLLAERLALQRGPDGRATDVGQELEQLWWDAAVTNHHDFITGTSPDAVADGEQWPWVERAMARAEALVERLARAAPHARRNATQSPALSAHEHGAADPFSLRAADAFSTKSTDPFQIEPSDPFALDAAERDSSRGSGTAWPSPPGGTAPAAAPAQRPLPAWERCDDRVRITTPFYALELSEAHGGGIVGACGAAASGQPRSAKGEPLLSAVSNDVCSWRDTGGLWRMGHEYRGGSLRLAGRCSERPAALEVRASAACLEVSCCVPCDGEPVRRTLWLRSDSPLVFGRVEGRAARGHTLTVAFETGMPLQRLWMEQPGGVVERPLQRIYRPTFWPAQGFVHLWDEDCHHGLALLLPAPCGLTCGAGGRVELVALRNATQERPFGVIPLPAHPARGYEHQTCAFDYALLFTPPGLWPQHGLVRLAHGLDAARWGTGAGATPWQEELPGVVIEAAGQAQPDVAVLALKHAARGEGVIVRLLAAGCVGETVYVSLPGSDIQGARLCDARERDLEALPVEKGRVRLTLPGSMATLRLLLRPLG